MLITFRAKLSSLWYIYVRTIKETLYNFKDCNLTLHKYIFEGYKSELFFLLCSLGKKGVIEHFVST